MKLILAILVISYQISNARILMDKTALVINDSVVTYSEIQRIKNTLAQRQQLAGFIFTKTTMTNAEIAAALIDSFVIRKALSEIGYQVTEAQIDEGIKQKERAFGVSREVLKKQLESNGIEFSEYEEMYKLSLEYNLFIERIISPLISVSDQEIKNLFIRKNADDKTLTFEYDLTLFQIPSFDRLEQEKFKKEVELFKTRGITSEEYKNIDTQYLGKISEDALNSNAKNALAGKTEGEYSNVFKRNNFYQLFYINKKELKESEKFLTQKPRLERELIAQETEKVKSLWLRRESNSLYILNLL